MKKLFLSGVLTVIMALSFCIACTPAEKPDNSGNNPAEEPDNTDYGSLKIADVAAWIDYPASEFYLEFEKPEYSEEELTYEYDTTKLSVDAEKHTVKALADNGAALSSLQTADKTGRYEVKVSSKHFSTSFYVDCYRVNKGATQYTGIKTFDAATFPDYVKTLKNKWSSEGVNGATTLFIGDSFFDTRFFWTEFYKTFEGTNAMSFGISSSTSYYWEVLADDALCAELLSAKGIDTPLLKNVKPKNLVVNIGTNNVWMAGTDADETVNALQRLFTLLHSKMPNTKIYYYGMAPRGTDAGKQAVIDSVNAQMKRWCGARKWMTYVTTCEKLTLNDLQGDQIHPKAETYAYYVEDLFNAGIRF